MTENDDIGREAADRILNRMDGKPNYVEEIAACIRDHTAARGVDLWAVDIEGYTAAEWADVTGRDPSTVQRNVRRAQAD